jgi:hypothetical protein
VLAPPRHEDAAQSRWRRAVRTAVPQSTLDWLLESDFANPGVRYFALRDLLDVPEDSVDLAEARSAIMAAGPVPAILGAQQPDGHWQKPGAGYSTKYRGTVWQLIQLDHLGADPIDSRVALACDYVLAHTQSPSGGFSATGAIRETPPPPSLAIHCLNGNLLAALLHFRRLDDERVQRAIDWQAYAITGEDPSFAYYKSGTTGPGFACGSNYGLPCAWGANKAARALLAVPPTARGEHVRRALDAIANFLLSRDPAVADYPYQERVSQTWFRLGMPFSYWSDVLETIENLVDLGYGTDTRLDAAFEFILSKRDSEDHWRMENSINGKTWADVETKGRPSKWVTLRALTVLRRADRLAALA